MSDLNKSKIINIEKDVKVLNRLDYDFEKINIDKQYKEGVVMVNISKVKLKKTQPCNIYYEKAVNKLVESIKKYGIVEPLIVQDKGDYYEIIAGERRWRASQLAGITEVPVVISNVPQE